jgi:hypothetical protein
VRSSAERIQVGCRLVLSPDNASEPASSTPDEPSPSKPPYDDHVLIAEVARTTTKDVARFKVDKPEPPRRTSIAASET